MNRDQRAADLAIHGWAPYADRVLHWWCFWNATLDYGWSYDELPRGGVVVKTAIHPPPSWECEWDAVQAEVFEELVRRITAEKTWAEAP